MKKVFLMLAVLFGSSIAGRAEEINSLGFTSDTRILTISTTPTQPTQIFIRDSFIQTNLIISTMPFQIFVSSVSTNLSTSNTTLIPAASSGTTTTVATSVQWTPDGPRASYAGQLFGFSNAANPPTISVLRTK